ncbi:hypothetical protein ACHAXT_001563 [Thalassiosira profunda]
MTTREDVAYRLGTAWLRLTTGGANYCPPAQEEVVVFANALLAQNSVKLMGTWSRRLSQNVECTVSVKGALSWIWSDDVAEGVNGPITCTRLNVDIERMNISVCKAGEGQSSNDDAPVDGGDDNIMDSVLLRWLGGVSLKSSSIRMCNVHFEEGMALGDSLRFLFAATESDVFSLLPGDIESEDDVTVPLTIKRINVVHGAPGISVHFRCQILDYSRFGRGQKWSLGAMAASLPILAYHVHLQLTGMSASRTEKEFHAEIKNVRQLSIDGGGAAMYLKHVLQHATLSFCNGELSVKLPKQLAFVRKVSNHQTSHIEPIHLPFPVLLDAQQITVDTEDTEADVRLISAEKAAITLAPASMISAVAQSFHAEQMKLGDHLVLKSVSCCCSFNATTGCLDNFSATIDNATFDACSRGVQWLHEVIDWAGESDRPIPLPCAKVSSIHVVQQSMFNGNEVELSSIDGDDDATSLSIIATLAKNLLRVAESWRAAQTERRANYADSIAVSTGLVVAGASLTTPVGAAVGAGVAVASLAARDQIGSAVVSGKESRGATEHDRYHFGDLTRGIVAAGKESRGAENESYRFGDFSRGLFASMKGTKTKKESANASPRHEAASGSSSNKQTGAIERVVRSGKQSRGASEDDSYSFGDYTRGLVAAGKESRGAYSFGDVSRGLSKQFSTKDDFEGEGNSSEDICCEKPSVLQDKKRLAGVGGMSAGALVGTALLGPVGLVAGSYIGSKVARSAVSNKDPAPADNDAARGDESFVEEEYFDPSS